MWKSLKYKSKREVQRQLQKSYFQMRAEGLSALRIIFSISLLVTVQKCWLFVKVYKVKNVNVGGGGGGGGGEKKKKKLVNVRSLGTP